MKTPSHGADFRLKPHPLFFLAGAISAFSGDLLLFLAATFAALEHECAHAFVARRYGFSLDRIVLMPYGAVLSGDLSGIPPKEELLVCLAGPLANALTALGFVALWWLFPETYPYTDAAAHVSFSLFLVNLLPAYPLDGGRILRIALRPLGERRATIFCRAATFVTAAGILALFLASCFSKPNFGALIFAVLLLAGAFGGGRYERSFRKKNFDRGIEEKRIALDGAITVGRAIRYLRDDRYLVFVVMENGTFSGELTEEEFLAALEAGEYDKPLKALL